MKKLFLSSLFFLFLGSMFAQEQIINSHDAADADTNYFLFFENVSAVPEESFINVDYVTDNVYEGAAAMKLEYKVNNAESWGGFVKLEHWTGDSTGTYDWSMWDTLSLWYNNIVPQDQSGRVHLRVNLHDVSDAANGNYSYDVNEVEYHYSFHYILDNEPGWNQIKIPLVNNYNWDGNGFNLTGWAGIQGNQTLDLDKIKGFSYEFSINGSGNGDSVAGTIILDKLHLIGVAEHPWLIFNGKSLHSSLGQFTWGQSNLELIEGGGEDPKTNALLWTQGNEWNNGWSGAGWNVNPAADLGFRWDLDSLKFKAKIDAGTGKIRMQFESGGDGVVGHPFDPIADGAWHDYALPLRDFVVIDGKANFNPAAITVFQFMGDASAIAGQKIYFDFIWTGNPIIDVANPEPPLGVSAVPGTYINLVTWTDVPGENNESYDVYYSFSPITDLTATGVETVGKGLPAGNPVAEHILRAPKTDQSLTYYYAVVCVDESGNVSEIAPAASSVSNTAKGVTIIHPTAPPQFAVDGDLSEWSAITPFRMYPSDGSGTVVAQNSVIDGDNDLSLNAYVAVDAEYMYLAFDVNDDIVVKNETIASYLTDGCDIFFGLYDWRGASHTGYKRGAEPDYHLRFTAFGPMTDNPGGTLVVDSLDYIWHDKFPTGYIIETKISWTALATIPTPDDEVFVPKVGMRIPIDYSINDADATNQREGILTYSPMNDDQSWADVSRWTDTWIGDQFFVGVNDEEFTPINFSLAQNYPNPFNPSTLIQYTLNEQNHVTLKVYNLLGQEIATLVNTVKGPGIHSVKFDAGNLSTGVYIYQIQAGSLVSSKKMVLVK
ncbi:MAG: sugar-binding protein [Bacteroidota bacterium]